MIRNNRYWDRRQFNIAAGVSVGLACMNQCRAQDTALSRAQVTARASRDRVRVGVIGLGSRGFNLVDELLKLDDVDITAVCDVDRLHYRDQSWGKGQRMGREAAQDYISKKGRSKPDGFVDFRDVCNRNDIDAVVIATPDHWHALCTIIAIRSNKDVYCEKPVTHWFHEGMTICREVAKNQTVFQTGSQQRSDPEFRRTVDLVRNGLLGNIKRVEVGLPSGYDQAQADTEPLPIREDLNYDLWCGPAPKLPYSRATHHRWWRGHRAFGGGVLMDWIGHHNDIAHWALGLDASGPKLVEAVDWQFPADGFYNTPWHFTIRCEYDNGVTSTISDSNPLGLKVIGERGWVHVTRGKIAASDPKWIAPDFEVGSNRVPVSPGHMRNFIDCVKSRSACIATAETGHRSITPGHLGYVSQALGRPLRWDAINQTIVDDPVADQLLRSSKYREPWQLPT